MPIPTGTGVLHIIVDVSFHVVNEFILKSFFLDIFVDIVFSDFLFIFEILECSVTCDLEFQFMFHPSILIVNRS